MVEIARVAGKLEAAERIGVAWVVGAEEEAIVARAEAGSEAVEYLQAVRAEAAGFVRAAGLVEVVAASLVVRATGWAESGQFERTQVAEMAPL